MHVRRWLCASISLVSVIALLQLFTLSSVARASAFYWYLNYGGSTSNCWQIGTPPGTSTFTCDSVGANYLASHMQNGNPTPNGDYCAYYGLAPISSLQPFGQPVLTGWNPSPPQNYQYGYHDSTGYYSACQAEGGQWGQWVNASEPGNHCYTTCGIHHAVAMGNLPNQKPWSSSFSPDDPELVLETNLQESFAEGSGSDWGAWGYLCADLTDNPATDHFVEYCLRDWSVNWAPNSACIGVGSGEWVCKLATDYYQIDSVFGSGTQFATNLSAQQTISDGSYGSWSFAAGITKSNMQNAINQLNSKFSAGLATSPSSYQMFGLEDGQEGWRNLEFLGGNETGLEAYTQY